jgi:hypothetical protein
MERGEGRGWKKEGERRLTTVVDGDVRKTEVKSFSEKER